jgi:hypothetical protein
VASESHRVGFEETPPTGRIAALVKGARREPWLRSRNETSTQRVVMMHAKLLSMLGAKR